MEPLQSPKQSGINWAQMGFRGVDLMGTLCPLHLISSLSHGVFSPGRQRRHWVEKRRAYRLGPMILGAEEP